MVNSTDSKFEFVMQMPNENPTKETRTKIRRQAMNSTISARRQTSTSVSSTRPESPSWPEANALLLSPPMPISGLELLVRDCGLDPMDLSALTSIHIGSIASQMFSLEPCNLRGVLSCRQHSYFSFIPSRFGHVIVLDDAFRCLITMVHSTLVPNYKPSNKVILERYGTALNSLQSAVNNPAGRYGTEALCATGMLALFELLHSPDGASWGHHIAGASRLIQLRGPTSFTSDFETVLLMALAYPISAEALLNNEKCFLEEDRWVEAFRIDTPLQDPFTERSELGISLMRLMAKTPGLVKRTGHAVVLQKTLQPEQFLVIARALRSLRSEIITWRRQFNTALIQRDKSTDNQPNDFGKRYELLGISLIIHILMSRMLCCIVPSEREILEEEVQNLAAEFKAVQGLVEQSQRAGFFLAQKARIADASIATHSDFEEFVGSAEIVDIWTMKRFNDSIGRKSCDGKTCCL